MAVRNPATIPLFCADATALTGEQRAERVTFVAASMWSTVRDAATLLGTHFEDNDLRIAMHQEATAWLQLALVGLANTRAQLVAAAAPPPQDAPAVPGGLPAGTGPIGPDGFPADAPPDATAAPTPAA